MTETPRPIADAESSVIEKILEGVDLQHRSFLVAQLRDARVSRKRFWVLDIEVGVDAVPATSVPTGPLPVRALVPNETDYRGELLVWVSDGFITGLEYAYVTDEVPAALPQLDEIQVFPA